MSSPLEHVKILILRHLISGDAFFAGAVCILLAIAWLHFQIGYWKRITPVLLISGTLLVLLSAIPFPDLFWGFLAATTSIWLGAQLASDSKISLKPPALWAKHASPGILRLLTLGTVLGWCGSIGLALRWRSMPAPLLPENSQLIIIADSITAGTGERGIRTWPEILSQSGKIEIIDLSRMGATVESAYNRVKELPLPPGSVFIELGGNDLLGGTSVFDFERSLELLFQKVSANDRTVLMFELPLPPLGNRFGQIQHRMARRYRIQLIPRRVLAILLLSPETTSDSIHLTQQGHAQLARIVEDLFRQPH